MLEVFNKDNIKDIYKKKPLIVYQSLLGSCGPSGLMVCVFDDGSSYAFICLAKDRHLYKEIIKQIPEFSLLTTGEVDGEYREPYLRDLDLTYLGLGNLAYVTHSIFNGLGKVELTKRFGLFEAILKDYTSQNLWEILKKVRKEVHEIDF